MNNIDILRRLRAAEPFRPFRFRAGGETIDVEHPHQICFDSEFRRVHGYSCGGRTMLAGFTAEEVSAIEVQCWVPAEKAGIPELPEGYPRGGE
jgi:hypothetical protein